MGESEETQQPSQIGYSIEQKRWDSELPSHLFYFTILETRN